MTQPRGKHDAKDTRSHHEEPETAASRSESAGSDDLQDTYEPDLLDSASESWRYLQFVEILDEIGNPRDERTDT